MDVDEDEEGTQSIKRVPDYDIEVDFSLLDEDDREVRISSYQYLLSFHVYSSEWLKRSRSRIQRPDSQNLCRYRACSSEYESYG